MEEVSGTPSVPDVEGATIASSGLTDYEKGYLDGLLRGTRPGGPGRTWTEKYEKAAAGFLAERGKKGWKVQTYRG